MYFAVSKEYLVNEMYESLGVYVFLKGRSRPIIRQPLPSPNNYNIVLSAILIKDVL
jgi:hypothetical protein